MIRAPTEEKLAGEDGKARSAYLQRGHGLRSKGSEKGDYMPSLSGVQAKPKRKKQPLDAKGEEGAIFSGGGNPRTQRHVRTKKTFELRQRLLRGGRRRDPIQKLRFRRNCPATGGKAKARQSKSQSGRVPLRGGGQTTKHGFCDKKPEKNWGKRIYSQSREMALQSSSRKPLPGGTVLHTKVDP